jgi:hypothetical protein
MLSIPVSGSYMNLKFHCERELPCYHIIQAPSFFIAKPRKKELLYVSSTASFLCMTDTYKKYCHGRKAVARAV